MYIICSFESIVSERGIDVRDSILRMICSENYEENNRNGSHTFKKNNKLVGNLLKF